MIMKDNKQIGFIYKNNESIDKILKYGDVVFEKGFLREKTSTTLPITFGGVGKDLKDYKIYGNTYQYTTTGKNSIIGLRNNTSNYINFYFNRNMATQNMILSGIFTYSVSNFTIFLQTSFGNESLLTNQSCTQNEKFSINMQFTNSQLENIVNSTSTPSIQFYRTGQMSGIGYSEIMLRPSDTTADYEPYTKGASPNPDYPQEIVSCGDRTKNLFNGIIEQEGKIIMQDGRYQDNSNYNVYRIDNIMPNTTYTFSEFQTISGINTATRALAYDSSNNLLGLLYETSRNESKRYERTITTPSDISYVLVQYRITDKDIQIEKGDIATSYEPYGYKIPVNVRSDNLFYASSTPSQLNLATYTKISENSFSLQYNQTTTSNKSPYARFDLDITQLKPNTQYIISKKNTIIGDNFSNIGALRLYINGSLESVVNSNTLTFTTPNNVTSLKIYFYLGYNNKSIGNSTITFYDIELMESSLISSKFIPYYNKTTNIYLNEPLRKIGEYSDYIDFKNGKVVRYFANNIPVINDITLQSSYTNVEYAKTNKPSNFSGYNSYSSVEVKCSHAVYKKNPSNWDSNNNVNKIYTGADKTQWWIGFAKGTGLTTIKEKLDGCNIIYPLSTPTEETITLPNIPTVDGNNTLNIETEITPTQVYIKYKSNT